MSFVERTQRLLPNERVLAVAEGQTGVYPLLWWLPYGEYLTMFNGRRAVAVTDRSITVLQAGRMRWNHRRPSRVLYSLPRTTPLGPATKRWTRFQLGSERIWMSRRAYSVLEQVQAAVPAPPPPPPVTAAEPAAPSA